MYNNLSSALLRELCEEVFPFISFRFVALHFPVVFIMHCGVLCFFLNFAAFCSKSSLLMPFRSFCKQFLKKKIALLSLKSIPFFFRRSFAVITV